jgi:ligand-binding sensor domain-containing protein
MIIEVRCLAVVAVFASLIVPAHEVRGQNWEVFNMSNAGFPSNSATDVAIDSQGIVWVATDWGLCRYDGMSWQTFQVDNSGLPENTIQCLAVDTLDRLWIGTLLHGVVVYDGASWTTYDVSNSGLPENQVRCITIDHRNWAWIGTYLGVACFTGGEWRVYNDQSTSYDGLMLNGPVIEDVAVREDGLVVIGTLNGGYHYLTDTCVQVHTTFTDFFPDNTQVAVANDNTSNQRWIATPSHGLVRHFDDWFSGLYFVYSTQTSNIPSNGLTSLELDATGRPWMGSNYAGVCVREGNGEFTIYNSTNSGLPDNTISDLVFASDGSLWIATFFGGAARMTFTTDLHELGARTCRVWPNPATGSVRVEWPTGAEGSNWFLMDAIGRVVRTGMVPLTGPGTVDISELPSGWHVLGIVGDGSYSQARILVL